MQSINLTDHFLIAMPAMVDSYFSKTLVYIAEHNDRGALTLHAERTDDLQPGLVAIPFGWWHRSTPEGRAVNALTNASLADDDRGSAYFHDTLVEVAPVS